MPVKYIAHYLGPNKLPQSVRAHLEEVAAAASRFAGKAGLASMGAIAGMLHDFGKYGRAFQSYIRSSEGMLDPDAEPVDADKLKGKIDHSTAGAQLVWNAIKDRSPFHRLVAQVLALTIASHHSGLIDCLSPDGGDRFTSRMEKTEEKSHLEEAVRGSDGDVSLRVNELIHGPVCGEELKSRLQELFRGEPSHEVRECYVGMLTRFLFSALIDADRLSAAGRSEARKGEASGPCWEELVERLEESISGIEQKNWVDKLRSEVSLICRRFAGRERGLYQLTVPTGGGKTLSSLRFGLHHGRIHKMDRLIYVIPYTSIIDQNASIARKILERDVGVGSDPIVLEHHSNLIADRETPRLMLLAENWDAPVIFTTTVQFLETLFSGGTRAVRRMHNLANSVIIFDEIQTLPIKVVHLFNNAINFLVKQCGSTVVFCTATQPLLDAVSTEKGAARLSAQPEMVPSSMGLFKELSRTEVLDERRIGGWSESELSELIRAEAQRTGSALAIVNTKAAARALYYLCESRGGKTCHLSTSMCPAHRMKELEEIRAVLKDEEHEPLICVSTQLIEAGVDADFGTVVRYLAGLDSIAQAAGRCNRNGRQKVGRVFVVNPSRENLDRLPEIKIGKEMAERVLDEFSRAPAEFDHCRISPKAIQRYYRYYFFNRSKEMVYRVPAREIGHDDDLLNMLSRNTLSSEAWMRTEKPGYALSLRQSFKTAGRVFEVIDAPTEGVIVPYGQDGPRIIAELCATSDPGETRRLIRLAQRFSVNLYPYEIERLSRLRGIYETQQGSGIFYLDKRHYSETLGVVLDREEPMPFLEG